MLYNCEGALVFLLVLFLVGYAWARWQVNYKNR